MIYLLFGEMGCGKNYVGEKLAAYLECPFFDGDDVLPDDLKEKVARGKPLTIPDVDRYIKDYLAPAIKTRRGKSRHLVVAQALYTKRHREYLLDKYPDTRLVHVKAPSFYTHAKRLLSRDKGLYWLLVAIVSKPFFQFSEQSCIEIKSDARVLKSIKENF